MIRRLQNGVWAGFVLLALAALAVLFDVAVARAQETRAPDLVLDGALTGRGAPDLCRGPVQGPVRRRAADRRVRLYRRGAALGHRPGPARSRAVSGLERRQQKPLHGIGERRHAVLPAGTSESRHMAAGAGRAQPAQGRAGRLRRQGLVPAEGARRSRGFAPAAPEGEGRWWRGDLHMHTGHSDGSCLSRRGGQGSLPALQDGRGRRRPRPRLHRDHRPQHDLASRGDA